jgi:hypothetical protein
MGKRAPKLPGSHSPVSLEEVLFERECMAAAPLSYSFPFSAASLCAITSFRWVSKPWKDGQLYGQPVSTSVVQKDPANDCGNIQCKWNGQQGLAFQGAEVPAAAEQQVGDRSRSKIGGFRSH